MTHSLEVAQIGKGLALRLGANPDLVETISLIHDLGHPPFGHAGEDELNVLMEDHGGFEANGQNIRLLTFLEPKDSRYLGINLTCAALDGQWKYKIPYPKDKRKFYFQAYKEILDWIATDQFDAPTRLGVNKKEDVSDALPNSAGSYFASMTDRTRSISASQLNNLGTPVVSIKPRKRKERLVGSPLPLCSSHVLKLTRSSSVEELKKYRLQLDFSVAEDGQVRNVKVVESNAPVRLNVYVKNMLTSTRYRPRLENGSPAVTKQVIMHETFTNEGLLSDYDDSPLDASTTAIFQGCLQMAAMPDG